MVVSIGSNLEGPEEQVRQAIDELRKNFEVISVSSLYRTSPIGPIEQPDFCNAIAIIEDTREPVEVLTMLHAIENKAGRVRDQHWGPRVLDLDLIAAGEMRSADPRCLLPHPRAHERAFVIVPWAEVDPEAILPGHGPIRDLIAGAEGKVQR